MKVKSWQAFLIYCGTLLSGFIWTTFFKDAPYSVLATWSCAGLGIYVGKRLAQKYKTFNGQNIEQSVQKNEHQDVK